MRWVDLYIGFLSAVMVFASVVTYVSGAGWATPALLIAAVATSVLVVLRVRNNEKVVLVGEPPGRPLDDVREAIDEEGFGLKVCPGPTAARTCPYLLGEACPYVDPKLQAALIYRATEQSGPVAPCHEALGVPAVFMVEGSSEPASFGNGRARIGFERGPSAVVETIRLTEQRMRRAETSNEPDYGE